MKTKDDAAKILFEQGWTYSQIRSVLDNERISLRMPQTLPALEPLILPKRPWVEVISSSERSGLKTWFPCADKPNMTPIQLRQEYEGSFKSDPTNE